MKEIYRNLDKIRDWIRNAPNPNSFKNNNQFMQFLCDLMSQCLYMMKISCMLVPKIESSQNGMTRNKAIISGHMIRIYKLFEGILIHISNRQEELANIFYRSMFETYIRMLYLMNSKNDTFKNFILTSYKSDKEVFLDLNNKSKRRQLIKIEKRILTRIKTKLKRDNITQKVLLNNKNWKLDGKSFRKILGDVWDDSAYPYSFGAGSNMMHGNWLELTAYHLIKDGRYYHPKIDYDDPDPRLACSVTRIGLSAALDFIEWRKSDKEKNVSDIILDLFELNIETDEYHESILTP